MLVLTLKEGDYVLIGDDIKVYFEHKISRGSLDLAIEAPEGVPVLRGKLYEELHGGKKLHGGKGGRDATHNTKQRRLRDDRG